MESKVKDVNGPGPEVQEVSDSVALVDRATAEHRQEIRLAAGLNPAVWPDERIAALARTVVPEGTSAPEFAMFLGICDRYGLDPVAREIWLAKDDDGKTMILTGRDSYLSIAERDDRYRGFDSGVVYEGDVFEIIREGGVVTITHGIGQNRGKRVRAYCVCYREGRRPVLVVREWDQYKALHTKRNWSRNPDDMLEARVITAAHRLQYRISGVYTPEEVEGGTPEAEAEVMADAASGATKLRLEELRSQINGRTGVAAPEKVTVDLDREYVRFGKFRNPPRTWIELLDDPVGFAYVKHFVLEQPYEHPSITPEIREALQGEIDDREALRATEPAEDEAPGASESDESDPGPESQGEDPEAGEPNVDALAEALAVVDELVEIGLATHVERDEALLLAEEKDVDGMTALVAKLKERTEGAKAEAAKDDLQS